MDCKEWIELLIPIISNGLILWGIQLIVMRKIEDKNNNDQIKNEVYRNNLSLIEEGLHSCRVLTFVAVNKGNDCDFFNAIDQLHNNIRKLYLFYEDYHIIINEDAECKKMYTELNNRFASTKWNDTATVTAFLSDCELLLHNIMDSTLKHIYKVK